MLALHALLLLLAVAVTALDCGGDTILHQTIPDDRINDGICDCCNGRDENETSIQCPNTCESRSLDAASQLTQFVSLTEKGAGAVSKIVLPSGTASRVLAHKSSRLSEIEASLESIKSAYTKEARKGAASVQSKLRSFEADAAALSSEGRSLQSALSVEDFGGNARLLALLDSPCFVSDPVGEKSSKGGSTTSAPKTYVYAICAFGNVTQYEVNPEEWKRRDAMDKLSWIAVDAMGSMAADSSTSSLVFGDPTLLGLFRGYLPLTALDDHIYTGTILNDAPVTVAKLFNGTRRPESLSPRISLPASHATELADTVLYYEGPSTCQVEDMVAKRRVYEIHVCPGSTPALLHTTLQLVAASHGTEVTPSSMSSPWHLSRGRLPARFAQRPWNSNSDGARVVPLSLGPASVAAGLNNTAAALHLAPRIVHVEEDGLCTYKIYVATPLACSRSVLKDAQVALRALRAALKRAKE